MASIDTQCLSGNCLDKNDAKKLLSLELLETGNHLFYMCVFSVRHPCIKTQLTYLSEKITKNMEINS